MLSLGCWKAGAPSSLPTTSKPRDIVPGEAAGGRQGCRTRGGRAGRLPCAGVLLPVPLPLPPRGSARARLFRAAPLRAGRRRGGEEGGAGSGGAVRASWRGGRVSRRGQVRENFADSARGGGAPLAVRRQPPPARHGRPPRPRDVLGQEGPGLPGRGRAARPGAAGRPRLPRVAARPAAPPCRPPRPAAAAESRLRAAAAAGVHQAGPGPGGAGGTGPGGAAGTEPGREAPPGGEHPPAPDQHLPERPHLAAPPAARALAPAVSTAGGRWGRGTGAVPAAAVAPRAGSAGGRVSLHYLSLRSVEGFGNFPITSALRWITPFALRLKSIGDFAAATKAAQSCVLVLRVQVVFSRSPGSVFSVLKLRCSAAFLPLLSPG